MADLTDEEKRRAAAIAGLPISAVPDLTGEEGWRTAAGDFTEEVLHQAIGSTNPRLGIGMRIGIG